MTTRDDIHDQILTEGPSPGTTFLILSELKKKGHMTRTIQESIKALNVFPTDLRIRKLLADTYFEAGLLAQAEVEAEQVASLLDKDLISVYRLRADIFEKQGRNEEAVGSLRIYLSHEPDDEHALNLLEQLEVGEEESDEVSSVVVEGVPPAPVEESIEGLPEIATPTLAEVYFDQGQIERAMVIYEKIIEKNPDDQKSKERLSELRIAIETTGEAAAEKDADVEEAPDRVLETAGEAEETGPVDRASEKKKKMISILEAWRRNIRETPKTSAPV